MPPHTTTTETETETETTDDAALCTACCRPRPTTSGVDGEPYCDECLETHAKHPRDGHHP